MRDRCKTLAFLTHFHLQYASARSVRGEKPCLFVDSKWYKKILVAMRDRCKKNLLFTHFHLQFASRHIVREEMSRLLLITNSIRVFDRDARSLWKISFVHSISLTICFSSKC